MSSNRSVRLEDGSVTEEFGDVGNQSLAFLGAYGDLLIVANAIPVAMPAQNTFVKLVSGWSLGPTGRMTVDPVAATIAAQIAGTYATQFTVAYTSAVGTNTLFFAIFKNGVPTVRGSSWTDTAAFPNTVTLTGLDALLPGDVLDARVECTTAAGITIVVTDANFNCFRVGA